MVLARLIAWSAIGCRSNDTEPTWAPAQHDQLCVCRPCAGDAPGKKIWANRSSADVTEALSIAHGA